MRVRLRDTIDEVCGFTFGTVYNANEKGTITDDDGDVRKYVCDVDDISSDKWFVEVKDGRDFDKQPVDWSKVKGTEEHRAKAAGIDVGLIQAAPEPEFVDAVDFINKAAEYVGGARAKTHGDKGTNFRTTAALHDGLDLATEIADVRLDPALRFALQMILSKISRVVSGAYNPDDFVDIAGYAGCAGEIAAQLDADK